jgi:magnesium transporter
MNFHGDVSPFNMPELRWYWGYPFALALMATIAATLIIFFRRQGWIGSSKRSSQTRNLRKGKNDL